MTLEIFTNKLVCNTFRYISSFLVLLFYLSKVAFTPLQYLGFLNANVGVVKPFIEVIATVLLKLN